MPDITMCVNKQCPLRSRCYRYRAVPSSWQSYAMYRYIVKIGDDKKPEYECDMFWEIDGRVLRSTEEADAQYVPTDIKQKDVK